MAASDSQSVMSPNPARKTTTVSDGKHREWMNLTAVTWPWVSLKEMQRRNLLWKRSHFRRACGRIVQDPETFFVHTLCTLLLFLVFGDNSTRERKADGEVALVQQRKLLARENALADSAIPRSALEEQDRVKSAFSVVIRIF